MGAGQAFHSIFPDRTDVIGGKVFAGAPSTDRVVGASKCVVAEMLATGALSEVIEMEASFQAKGSGEGRQAGSLSDVLCLGAGDGNDDGGSRFAFASFVGSEPPGFLGEEESRVVGGELFPNIEESMGGGDAVDNKLFYGHVQLERGVLGMRWSKLDALELRAVALIISMVIRVMLWRESPSIL